LGGLLFGFDTAVIAGTTSALTQVYYLSPDRLGLTVSSAVWGTVAGSLLAGFPGERFGRRSALKMMGVLYVISALGCALTWNWHSLVLFRFMGGLGIGGSSVLGPMYIAEIAPAESRGRLVAVFQFNVVLGILIAYLSNYLVTLAGFGAAEWRWEFGVAAFPAILFLLLLFAIPESPRWLVSQNKSEDASQVLKHIGEQNVQQAIQEISDSIQVEKMETGERLFSSKHTFPIFLAVSIAVFNQLSGINAILYYLNSIFAYAGFSKVSANLQAVAIGLTNLVFTMIAMSVIDKIGRKTLLLVGSVGTALCLGGVSAIFLEWKASKHIGVVVDWFHCVLRVLARCSDLGLFGGSISQRCPGQRPKPGKFLSLDHERTDLDGVPANGSPLRRLSVRIFCLHDGGPVLRCLVDLP
jgi:sugar porter (SP) family MFS transporter